MDAKSYSLLHTQLCGVTRTGHIAPWLCAHRALRRTVCSAVRSCINCVSTRAHPCSGSVVLTKGGAGSACVRHGGVRSRLEQRLAAPSAPVRVPPDAALRPERKAMLPTRCLQERRRTDDYAKLAGARVEV